MTSTHDDDPGSRACDAADPCRDVRLECERLARRAEDLERVIASAGVGYCSLRGRTLQLTASAQFKAEFGWPPDAEPAWQDLLQRVPDERLTAAISACLDSGAPLDLTVLARWPDGTIHPISLRGRVHRTDGGTPERLIITSRNASGERQASLEAQQRHAVLMERETQVRRQAEAANRAKDEFLSVISHELRSPLNAILGWNRILLLKRPDDAEVAAITPRIEQSAKTQLKIVNDLLDLGRIGTGKLKIEPRPLQLAPLVSAAVDLARPAAARKGIEVVTDLSGGPAQTRADPERMQQVIANLLSNAIKFTPSGGRIRVCLRSEGGRIELSVADSGQGIDPSLLPCIFDRFRQGDSSSTRHAGGLGLGLALVREIVNLHGGTVAASSDGAGTGAKFVVNLPAVPRWRGSNGSGGQESPTDGSGGPDAHSLGGLSILVVDDEADARTIVAEALRLEGADVTVTDSAERALQWLQSAGAHFDIVVSDIGMPEEDGYSLVRKLRALEKGRETLAIAVTGYVSRSDIEAAMDAGFDLHIPKPVDFDIFVPMVRRLAGAARA